MTVNNEKRTKTVRVVLSASLIAVILPLVGISHAVETDMPLAETSIESVGTNHTVTEGTNMTFIEKSIDPTEFAGTLTSETRQIGNHLYVKHTYTSDELKHYNVDHIYREEIVPISEHMRTQDLDSAAGAPVSKPHKTKLVHKDDTSKIDRIRHGEHTISTGTFIQWKIVEQDEAADTKRVAFHPPVRPVTHVEDWASKKNGFVYTSYDPINLIWRDTVSSGGDLLSKVDRRIRSQGWDDRCIYSTDLYVSIDGTWTKQDKHFIDSSNQYFCTQFHVRAWEVNDDLVIGSAHEEEGIILPPWYQIDVKHTSRTGPSSWERNVLPFGGAYHFLEGFDSAEDEAAGEFYGGCWSTSKDSHDLDNVYTRQYYRNSVLQYSAYNDGLATEILCS